MKATKHKPDVDAQIRGNKANPYHLSVGAVVTKDTKVAVIRKKAGSITLPRETIYVNESVEECILRGVREELGIKAKLGKFLGSNVSYFNRPDGTKIEKTTLYFSADFVETALKSPALDEVDNEILWLDKLEACKKLKETKNPEYLIIQRSALT